MYKIIGILTSAKQRGPTRLALDRLGTTTIKVARRHYHAELIVGLVPESSQAPTPRVW